jgi:hypothetical protein
MMSVCPDAVLLKVVTSEDHQVVLQKRKGLAGTKLSLDEDLTLMQQTCKLELWPQFKEAKATNKRVFWCAIKLSVDGIQIWSPSSV